MSSCARVSKGLGASPLHGWLVLSGSEAAVGSETIVATHSAMTMVTGIHTFQSFGKVNVDPALDTLS